MQKCFEKVKIPRQNYLPEKNMVGFTRKGSLQIRLIQIHTETFLFEFGRRIGCVHYGKEFF